MLYTAKCFWPGITEDQLRLATAQASNRIEKQGQTTFRGALYLPGDELELCLFESLSPARVRRASDDAGIPCERVIETIWLAPRTTGANPRCGA